MHISLMDFITSAVTWSNIAQPFFFMALILRDILWLRIVLVLAEICLLVTGILLSDIGLITWNIIFLCINFYNIYFLFLERKPVKITQEYIDLYEKIFPTMTSREFMSLLDAGIVEVASDESTILTGQGNDSLKILLSGTVKIMRENNVLDYLYRGRFIGEMELLTGQKAVATIKPEGHVEYITWKSTDIRKLQKNNPQVYIKLLGILSNDLILKIKSHHH